MKPVRHCAIAVVFSGILMCMSACDHDVTIGSVVSEDGSIERTVILHDADSSDISHNFLGINDSKGWSTVVQPAPGIKEGDSKEKDFSITFKKRFASAAEANSEMDSETDTLLRIHSTFEKENRWFYTYIEYSDTYRKLNPFKTLSPEDYFTREDFAFIDRLPAEGKAITKADSLYLARLNEKIFDIYGGRTIFEELYSHMLTTMDAYNVAPAWKDSLVRRKEEIYQKFLRDSMDENAGFPDAAGFDIPLPPAARAEFVEKAKAVEKRIEFVSEAASGKFKHVIQMPWDLTDSNADSVSNNELHWHPPVIKFLLADYTMTARSRKMNLWALLVSAGVVMGTVGLFFIRRRS